MKRVDEVPGLVPPINVNIDGTPRPLESEESLRAHATDVKGYCILLELMAAVLHHQAGLNVMSTTTLALVETQKHLLVTSQTNHDYQVDVPKIYELIQTLCHVKYTDLVHYLGLASTYQQDADRVIALRRQASAKERTSSSREAKALLEAINFVYYTLYPNFVRLNQLIRQYGADWLAFHMEERIRFVTVVRDRDIFIYKSPPKTGLHGEARIIRFIAIRENFQLRELEELVLSEMGARLHEYAYTKGQLKERIQSWGNYFGSSQGTCNECAAMLGDYGAHCGFARTSKASDSSNWIDPLTLSSPKRQVSASKRWSVEMHVERLVEQQPWSSSKMEQ